MDVYFPEYYQAFHCIASACPDSCCKEWEVDIDPAAARYYRTLPGALGDRLRSVLRDTTDGTVMSIENGRCPMWRQDGLCEIQAQLGYDALCRVCREFPRLRHDYGDFVELGLELSCPEAARLILSSPAPFVNTEAQPGGEAPDYDPDAMKILRRSREQLRGFLADENYTVPQALAVTLLYAHQVQEELDGGGRAVLVPEDALRLAVQVKNPRDPTLLFSFFSGLEILTPQWRARLTQTPIRAPWTQSFRALIRYFIDRYWLQAVADYDLVCRAKLAVASCLLVNALGGDPIETAQLFSKEIENDPDNVDSILDAAYTEPALTDANLLGLLLI